MASKSINAYAEDEDQPPQPQGLIAALKSALLPPIRPFLSRNAVRAYLTTALIVSTVFVLLGCAIAAYVLFYWSYIPRIGFERTIHLQFDNVYKHGVPKRTEHPYPYGSVSIAPDIVAMQGYDVMIEMVMPRTKDNQDAGNFMLEVAMYAQDETRGRLPFGMSPIDAARLDIAPTSTSTDTATVLALSRRHGIIPYRSQIVDLLHTVTTLPWFFFKLRDETDKLKIPVFERVSFAKGRSNLPATLHLEVQSTHRLQIYSAIVRFRARFTGLRWIMYNHRIISAAFFITTFWITELVFFGLAWAAVSFYISSQPETVKTELTGVEEDAGMIKQEEDDEPAVSDTERQFPTLSGQAPLRYSSDTQKIKRETEEESALPVVTPAAEADDEDEEDVDFLDSGIGTSMESSNPARRDSVRKRRGRQSGRAEEDEKP